MGRRPWFRRKRYVYGLTLAEAEERIASHLNGFTPDPDTKPSQPYQVSVRVANGQSKFYYVIGTVEPRAVQSSRVAKRSSTRFSRPACNPTVCPRRRTRPPRIPWAVRTRCCKIDWFGIKDRGDTLTNYQVMPGDRVVVPGTKPPGLLGSLLGN